MKVSIVIGSDSDFSIVQKGLAILNKFNVPFDLRVLSAHRTPFEVIDYTKNLEAEGIEVVIAAAGKAAHLPGVLAGLTILPVIGLPIKSSTMDGLDSLLSIVQMPEGIPVATVAINGAENAGLLAVSILSIKYPELKEMLLEFRKDMARKVLEKDRNIRIEAGVI